MLSFKPQVGKVKIGLTTGGFTIIIPYYFSPLKNTNGLGHFSMLRIMNLIESVNLFYFYRVSNYGVRF